MTLLRLGLRAGEVASLTLEDIDWRAAEIVVHGNGRHERMPLPVDVGEAIVGYRQRGRPATTSRAVFVRRIAPIGPLGRGGVSFIGMRYAMPPMTDTETGDFLNHHIKLAGRTDALFTADAITVIHNTARGYLRAINNIAVHALTAASPRANPVVDEKAARAALTETATD